MFRELRVWSRDDFANHLANNHKILIDNYLDTEKNKDIILIDKESIVYFSHADSDGDLAPIYCFKQADDRPDYIKMIPCQEELNWNKNFLEGEYEADSLFDKEMVYQLHEMPYARELNLKERSYKLSYMDCLLNARDAKAAIGPATNNGWVFAMCAEMYQKTAIKCKGNFKQDKLEFPMLRLTDKMYQTLTFIYIRGLQDFVMDSVKHTAGGSSSFELLYLRNMAKPQHQKEISRILSKDLELSPDQVAMMFSIINWANTTGILQACSDFLRVHNKGVFPVGDKLVNYKQHENFIQENSFFGELVEPIYQISRIAETNKQASKEEATAKLKSLSDSFNQLLA
jgi:hypothetical protein